MNTEERIALRESLPEVNEKYIDIEGLFENKNPRLAKAIPGFVYSYLKRVIHADSLNKFLYDHRNYWGTDYVEKILEYYKVNPQVQGLENITEAGRCVMTANHPLGGMDGIALMNAASRVRKDIVFPVNDILMNIPNLHELFIPINKHGSNADNIRLLNETFASDVMILYFPAGLVSRKQKGVIKDLEWKKTVITKAKTYKRNIIPAFIGGRNTNFFYNLANLRKKLKIKANIEMLYLADELVKLKDKNFKIIIGKEIPYTTFDKRFNDKQWALHLKDHVYGLENDPQLTFKYLENSHES